MLSSFPKDLINFTSNFLNISCATVIIRILRLFSLRSFFVQVRGRFYTSHSDKKQNSGAFLIFFHSEKHRPTNLPEIYQKAGADE